MESSSFMNALSSQAAKLKEKRVKKVVKSSTVRKKKQKELCACVCVSVCVCVTVCSSSVNSLSLNAVPSWSGLCTCV